MHQLTDSPKPSYQHKDPPRGVHPTGQMTHVVSSKFPGKGKKLLEILYNIMEEPLGYDQRAYTTEMLR